MAFIFSTAQQRYLDLVGDPGGTIDAFGKRNINIAIQDILNKYKFSWDKVTTDLTLVAGVSNLPTDYNPKWHLSDARIVASLDNDDNVFTEIPEWDRDKYTTDDYVYWITYDQTTHRHIFNSLTQTGTVTIYYQSLPTDLSADGDYCIIPDLEALSYLSASKSWIGNERDTLLAETYRKEADKLITAMYVGDMQSGETLIVGSVVGYDSDLYGG